MLLVKRGKGAQKDSALDLAHIYEVDNDAMVTLCPKYKSTNSGWKSIQPNRLFVSVTCLLWNQDCLCSLVVKAPVAE